LEALSEGGLRFAGFADDEAGKYSGRWERLEEELGTLLFRWPSGCLEENIIGLVTDADLERLLVDPNERRTGYRLRSLQDRLGTSNKEFDVLRASAGTKLRQTIIEAATGAIPEGVNLTAEEIKHHRAHEQSWFKSTEGGQELFDKVCGLGLWPALKDQLLPFANSVRVAIGLETITDIAP
jgi:putative ATP-dependent endonuclease of OLD family